jgi:hypothetical protein
MVVGERSQTQISLMRSQKLFKVSNVGQTSKTPTGQYTLALIQQNETFLLVHDSFE